MTRPGKPWGLRVARPVPSLPIQRGLPTPALLAHVLVAKYADHCPLYRQAEIYARAGVELDRSTLADWVGQSASLVGTLAAAVGAHVMAAERVHADDTTVPVLDPGRGKIKPADCRVTCAMIVRSPAQRRRRCCTTTARTAEASIREAISPDSAACCGRTGTAAMPGSTEAGSLRWSSRSNSLTRRGSCRASTALAARGGGAAGGGGPFADRHPSRLGGPRHSTVRGIAKSGRGCVMASGWWLAATACCG